MVRFLLAITILFGLTGVGSAQETSWPHPDYENTFRYLVDKKHFTDKSFFVRCLISGTNAYGSPTTNCHVPNKNGDIVGSFTIFIGKLPFEQKEILLNNCSGTVLKADCRYRFEGSIDKNENFFVISAGKVEALTKK